MEGDPALNTFPQLVVCGYYLMMAALLFLSMKDNPKVKFYCGFLDGKFTKAMFLLFCSSIVYPIDYTGTSDWRTVFEIGSIFLAVVSTIQLVKLCCGRKDKK